MRGSGGSVAVGLTVCAILLLVPAAAPAQERAFDVVEPTAALQRDTLPSAARLAVGGVVGGAVGLFGLGYLGAWAADETADPYDDLAAVGGFALGGFAGEILGMATGVHLADGARGSFWSDLGVSALGALGTVALLSALDTDGAPAWTAAGAGVAAQIGLTVWTEIGSR